MASICLVLAIFVTCGFSIRFSGDLAASSLISAQANCSTCGELSTLEPCDSGVTLRHGDTLPP